MTIMKQTLCFYGHFVVLCDKSMYLIIRQMSHVIQKLEVMFAKISTEHTDSSQPIVIGQARWSRGYDVCTSKQEAVGSNSARVACEVFFNRHLEST